MVDWDLFFGFSWEGSADAELGGHFAFLYNSCTKLEIIVQLNNSLTWSYSFVSHVLILELIGL